MYTAVTNGRGVRTEIVVNALNQPVEVRRAADVSEALARGEPLGGQDFSYFVQFAWDANDNLQSVTIENRDGTRPENGSTTTVRYAYDLLDDLVEVEEEISATETRVTRFAYDGNQNRIRAVLPEGNVRAWSWDERDLLLSATRGFGDADASTVQYAYDLNGNLRSLFDAEDNTGDGLPEESRVVRDGFDRLIELRDALGNRLLDTYDPASDMIRRRVEGHPPGPSPTNPSGATNVLLSDVSYLHDELGRVFEVDESIFVPAGGATARPVELHDVNADGVVASYFEYDALSRRTFAVEDDGDATQTVFDGASRAVETIDPVGNRVLVSYDQASNPVRVQSVEVSPEGLIPDQSFTTHYVWDSLDRLVRVTDNAGQTTRFQYDSRDNLVARSDPQGPLTADPLGLFPGVINGPGNTRSYRYDALNRLLAEVTDLRVGGAGSAPLDTSNPSNPDGQITVAFAWDANSRLVARSDDNGNTTRFAYDALDRLVQQIHADGEVHTYRFDRDDNLTQTVDPNGSVQTWTYDGLSRRVRCDVTRAPGIGGTTLRTYQYDGLSRLTRATDDNGSPSQATALERVYDSLSRLVEERQDGRVISSAWACRTKRLAYTYPGGRRIEQTFDAPNRIKTISDATGLIATAAFVGPGYRELKREYGNGTSLSYLDDSGTEAAGYDAVRRIVGLRHLLPDGVTAFVSRAYTYDRAGMRTSEQRLEGGGLSDVYRYDSAYRVVETLLDQGGPASAGRGVARYRYDGVGNRVEVTRQTGGAASSLALHGAERVDVGPSSTIQGDAVSLGAQTGRGGGNSAAIRLLPGATVVGRVAGPSVELQPGSVLEGDVETDALVARPGAAIGGDVGPYGPPEPLPEVQPITPGSQDVMVRAQHTQILASGAYRNVTVRHGGELVLEPGTYQLESLEVGQAGTVSVRGPVTVRVRSGLSFAPGARVAPASGLQTADVRWETTAPTVEVGHDVQLFGVLVAPSSEVRVGQGAQLTGTVHARRVDLIQAANVTSPAAAGEGGQTETLTYASNEVNEYTQIDGVPRSHDANGNLIHDGARSFTYDASNRLIAVFRASDDAPIAAYRYDALGRRTAKVVFSLTPPGAVLSETRFFYDGWRVCEEQDAAGRTLATYVYSPVYVDEPVQMVRTAAHPAGPGVVYYHQNARADVVALTDAAGQVIERRTYDDFGRSFDANGQAVAGSAVGNPYGFQGRRLDEETGLYYFRARYYDPYAGRFLQRDPVWDAGNVGNQYSFVGNSPLNGLDPMGTSELGWRIAQGGVDFLRGAGDFISFGLTKKAREAIYGERGKVINQGAYTAGEVAGVGIMVGTGAGLGTAAAKVTGKRLATQVVRAGWSAGRGRFVAYGTTALQAIGGAALGGSVAAARRGDPENATALMHSGIMAMSLGGAGGMPATPRRPCNEVSGQGQQPNAQGLYENLDIAKWPAERDMAEQLGVKPLRPGDPGFADLVNSGPVKWIVNEAGQPVVVPKFVSTPEGGVWEVPHSVAAGGRPVRAAGEADIAIVGDVSKGALNRHSGHYQPSGGEGIGVQAFRAAGLDVEVER